MPEYYRKVSDLPLDMPTSLRQHIIERIENHESLEVVWVSCEGESTDDKRNLVSVKFESSEGVFGFPGHYFPFNNTRGDQQPLVAIQFSSNTRKSNNFFK